MSLFNWFSRKPPADTPDERESSGLGHVDATEPISQAAGGRMRHSTTAPGSAANRKSERLERREMLYAIVRECMTQAGMLSSSYKFKVLSLDSRGRQYLVMMDLPREHASESGRLAEIESLIARHAKTRHDILVTAVYWRINELVTAGLTLVSTPVTAVDVVLAPEPVSIPAAATAAPSFKPRYEPLQQEEVTAFKKAIASAPTGSLAVATGSFVVSGPRNPTPFPDFEDTEVDERQSALSRTQYGDLI